MPSLTSDTVRWHRLQDLFQGALEREPAEREKWLEGECSGDRELRDDVVRLLEHATKPGDFLDPPGEGLLTAGTADGEPDPWTNRRLGNYRLVEQIAVGGMGVVWLAERADASYEQRVAIKIMHGWLLSEEQAQRFLQERQALASLVHPGITRLLDGGTTTEGLPYLVMELVEGTPLDEHCDAKRLGIRERIELVRLVGQGVSYAHRNLVVHRDLKPINILINSDGVPKLVDFGIAELLSREGVDSTQAASTGAMTPRYASPERFEGRTVSTVSDVYSLGVILYELLTGRRASQGEETTTQGTPRSIETDPLVPSHAVLAPIEQSPPARRDRLTAEEIALDRGTTPERLARELRGDLDRIISRAARKDPAERYRSVDQLLDDLERYDKQLPIQARPHSFGYVLAKLVHRNKSTCVIGVSLLIGLLFSVVLAVNGWRTAVREREVAEHVTTVLEAMITAPNLYLAQGDPVRVLETINDAVTGAFPDEPAAEARVRLAIARALTELWQFKPALEQSRLALELAQKAGPGAESLELHALALYARCSSWTQQKEGAAELALRALDMVAEADDISPHERAQLHSMLSWALWQATDGKEWERTEPMLEEAIEVFRSHPDSSPRDLAKSLHRLASMKWKRNLIVEDHALLSEAIELYRLSPRGIDRPYAEAHRAISYCYRRVGNKRAEGEALREFVKLTPDGLFEPSFSRDAVWRLALYEQAIGRSDVARDLFRRALHLQCLKLYSVTNSSDESWRTLAEALDEPMNTATLGEYAKAIVVQAAEKRVWHYGWILDRMPLLVRFIIEEGLTTEASELLDVCIARPGPSLKSNGLWHGRTKQLEGTIDWKAGRFEDARRRLTESYDQIVQARDEKHALSIRAAELLAEFNDEFGEPDEAARYRALIGSYVQASGSYGTYNVDVIRGLLAETEAPYSFELP